MNDSYDLYCQFDVLKHKEKYHHYLEVMILEDGTVVYAVPSHQEKAIQLSCERLGITRDELCEITPQEYYFDWLTWLMMQCKAVSVWSEFIKYYKINKAQYNTLKKLKLYGVYEGSLPSLSEIQKETIMDDPVEEIDVDYFSNLIENEECIICMYNEHGHCCIHNKTVSDNETCDCYDGF